jgi:hypothetical protein
MFAMTDWSRMFRGVQTIVREPSSADGLAQTISFARSNPDEFDDAAYWENVAQHMTGLPYAQVIQWAQEGIASLDLLKGWEALILDLGDCPDIFRLIRFGNQSSIDEGKLRRLMFSKSVIHATEFEEGISAPMRIFEWPSDTLVDHNVEELNDEILSWNVNSVDFDFHGDNGYLLWLATGSLAIVEPFREIERLPNYMKGRDKLYLLSGFEEIFMYLATVTADGVLFEAW